MRFATDTAYINDCIALLFEWIQIFAMALNNYGRVLSVLVYLFCRYYGIEPRGMAAGHIAPVAFLAGNDRLGKGSWQPSSLYHTLTKPNTPQLATKGRSRLVRHPSREEVEAKELEEIKRLDVCFSMFVCMYVCPACWILWNFLMSCPSVFLDYSCLLALFNIDLTISTPCQLSRLQCLHVYGL